MSERREYVLTDEQLQTLLERMKPDPVLYGSGGVPWFSTQQEKANRAWVALGEELGFDGKTVEPVPGKPRNVISAAPASGPLS
jgi:hypothetical protein